MSLIKHAAPVASAPIAIIGASCRLPGAPDEEAFWRLLEEGRCAVGDLPPGRWHAGRYLHPRTTEPGYSYSFAGGYIAEPLGFDPIVFGISPREAAEMDPQQRLLLEVVWEAVEDSGLRPSALAGADVGVYVGASSLDYGNLHTTDPAAIESHFMTGNTLSILSNRLSYIFDLRGPSFTIDTACSSSLVAFAEAQAAISSGRIDMAIVAGVNMLLSPTSFIGFSRAAMLSPTGLCRPFSARADGYVRAEGAVAVVLARLETAIASGFPVRAVAEASGINSDGRTNGISLPSAAGQRELLERLYGQGRIDTNRLAFVEAHGTGTRAGDPVEAEAIGSVLGRGRKQPLPIGSVKSNIGHLEPASGLAGMLKSILALEHRKLPATLHLDTINPAIDFPGLNLAVASAAVALPAEGTLWAGISSFGFGGTNAHVVIRQAEALERPAAAPADPGTPAELLVLSAYSPAALGDSATAYADFLLAGNDPASTASATGWQRDLAPHRLAIPVTGAADMAAGLRNFARTGQVADGVSGTAVAAAPTVCFAYSGNGSQWAGMGRVAIARSEAFRRHFHTIDKRYARLAGWSLLEALHGADLAAVLKRTRIAQPLLFAVQASLTAALAEWGLRPSMALGHSVGEVAAAHGAGAIGLDEALRLIFHRSERQEAVFGAGGMAAANTSADRVRALIAEYGLDTLAIAAMNSPNAATVSGPDEAIQAFAKAARQSRIAVRILDLAYPFHCGLLDPVRLPLLAALGSMEVGASRIPFVSAVSGGVLPGGELVGEYWWRNVREPVRFCDAVTTAGRLGANLFVEIGPRPILAANIADTLKAAGLDGSVMPTLANGPDADPLRGIVARATVLGAKVDTDRLFGTRQPGRTRLPPYPWQRRTYQQPATGEARDPQAATRHPLIGARLMAGSPEWRNTIDAATVPYLADHRIDGEVVVPGSALAEMALAVAREVFPAGPVGLEDFDLLQWLLLQPDAMRELSVRLAGDTSLVEIWSRPRLGGDAWTLHARGRIVQPASPPPPAVPRQPLPRRLSAEQVYDSVGAIGLEYGPSFRRVLRAERDDTTVEIELSPFEEPAGGATRSHVLHPIALDAAFHALFENARQRSDERHAFLPVRFTALRVDRDGAVPARARVVIERDTERSITASVTLYDAQGRFIASLANALFRAVVLDQSAVAPAFFGHERFRLMRQPDADGGAQAAAAIDACAAGSLPEAWLLLEGFTRSLADRCLRAVFGTAPALAAQSGAVLVPGSGAAITAGSGAAITAGSGAAIPAASVPLAVTLLEQLRAAGMATRTPAGWVLADAHELPAPDEILATIVAEHGGASAEIVLAAQALSGLEGALRSGEKLRIRDTVLAQFESESVLLVPVLGALAALCESMQARLGAEPLRVVVAEPSCLGVLRVLLPMLRSGRARVTVLGVDPAALARVAARAGAMDGLAFMAADEAPDASPGTGFDVGLWLGYAPCGAEEASLARAIARLLPPHAVLCVGLPPAHAAFDLLLGTLERWFAGSADPYAPIGRVAAAHQTAHAALAGGFDRVESRSLGDGMGLILLARPAAPAAAAQPGGAVLVMEDGLALSAHVTQALRAQGRSVTALAPAVGPAGMPEPVAADVVVFAGGPLDQVLIRLSAVLERLQSARCRLWVVVRGLEAGAATDPAAAAVQGFVRVAVNEYPVLDIRLIDVAPALDPAAAGMRLSGLLAMPPADMELGLDDTGLWAVRAVTGLPGETREHAVPAAGLSLRERGLQATFDWVERTRRDPAPDEIEVEIAASGLNFRDVMLANGLLDDDVLDDGLAGAVFGFECAGRVARAGAAVEGLQPGDAVMGFGRESFATHCTADARVFTKVPADIPLLAAATIPVAFLTAWYALVRLARIRPGEWVLVHGAAGGVGLAALQIARLRGARVAATVSAPDKRAVAELFGAERVYNSRDTAFRDAIVAELGGVDVVLNSLAGEAMQAGMKCLKPFGRFVELGKRDYVLNTSIGLRPFRRNLTYHGVDLDQLLAADLPLANRLMTELVGHFEDGSLLPLPYRGFDWRETAKAFQAMQAGGHVGKLIVRPMHPPVASSAAPVPFRAGAGAHLVVGGAGGFGFEAASWLIDKGARTVVVASRRGVIEPHLRDRAAVLRAAGVSLVVETLDVTDGAAVSALVDRVAAAHGRLAGVVHAATVLNDGLIAGLDSARLNAVLAPKVAGADNLDQATRAMALDYFVAFSSATTMVGNPGQGAYVAANGYLHGLMRRRRAAGLPALAVGWGAIADAGILDRDRELAGKLERMSGIAAMPARQALAHLGDLLSRGPACPPVVMCATFRSAGALQSLRLMRTPGLAGVFAGADAAGTATAADVATLIAGKDEPEARAIVAQLVATEVGRILRLAVEEIDTGRPLDELGLDSLMSLELRMGIEKRFAVELPVVAIGAGTSVNRLAARILAALRSEGAPVAAGPAERLIQQHGAARIEIDELVTLARDAKQGAAMEALL